MNLHAFLPYQLAVAADTVSRALAVVYADRFALGARAGLDKMQVSRALARMERDGLVERSLDADDRRHLRVRLKASGRSLYRRVVPMAQAREAFLLDGLDAAERAALVQALTKLQARAQQLLDQG